MKLQEIFEAVDSLHDLHEFPGGWIHADGKIVFNKYDEGEDPHQVEDHSYNAYIHFEDQLDWDDDVDMVDATHDIAWKHGWIKFAVSPVFLWAAWDKQVSRQAIEGLKELMVRSEKVRPNLKYEFTSGANEIHDQVPTLTKEQALQFLQGQTS